MFPRILSTLCVVLTFYIISTAAASPATYVEGTQRIQHNTHQALEMLLFGLTGHTYPIFRGFSGASEVTLLRLHPDTLKQGSNDSAVHFQKPGSITVSLPKDCFCIDFSGVAIKNWFFFTVSSYVEFNVCAACEVSLNFGPPSDPTKDSKPVLDTSIAAKYRISSVKAYNVFGRLFGIETALSEALSGTTWSDYLNLAVRGVWQNLTARMLNSMYDSYTVNIEYPFGRFTHSLGYVAAEVQSDKELLQIAYSPSSLLSRNNFFSSPPAAEHILSADYFAELYHKASALPWSLELTNEKLPANLSVRLDTTTFAQVVPDLAQTAKDLSMKLGSKISAVQARIDSKEKVVKVTGLECDVAVNEGNGVELLKGTFIMDFTLDLTLKSNTHVIRLVPLLRKADIEVTELHSSQYKALVKGGLTKIIQTLFDEYFAGICHERTLGNGIALTTFKENPDLEKSSIDFDEGSVTARVYYRDSY